jgi:LacI family transcriptional regulator
MRDVAALAGVATMTVSRVMNGSAPVTEETKERVHDAIKKLNYQPNPVARSLRQARSSSIGIIVPNFYDPFFSVCAHAISLVAKKHQYSVIVTTSDEDADVEFAEAKLMVLNHVEGLAIIPAAVGASRLDDPGLQSTHIVALDRPIRGDRFHSILVENQQGSKAAVRHLIEHGHKKIYYLGLSNKLYTIKARYEGYRKAMLQAGLVPDPFLTCVTQEDTYSVIQKALSGRKPATAFFVGNNLVMRHALHALAKLRVNIPDDVAIIGFDDFEMADIFYPPLTVVRQPTHELGRVAGELLFTKLSEKTIPLSGQQIMLPVELIIRQSCGCEPVEPPKRSRARKQ